MSISKIINQRIIDVSISRYVNPSKSGEDMFDDDIKQNSDVVETEPKIVITLEKAKLIITRDLDDEASDEPQDRAPIESVYSIDCFMNLTLNKHIDDEKLDSYNFNSVRKFCIGKKIKAFHTHSTGFEIEIENRHSPRLDYLWHTVSFFIKSTHYDCHKWIQTIKVDVFENEKGLNKMSKEFFELVRMPTGALKCIRNIVRDGLVVKAEFLDIADAIDDGILPRYVSKHKFKKSKKA